MSETVAMSAKSLEASALGINGLRAGTVQITVQERASAKDIHAALDRIFDLSGCLACGLLGIDVLLRPQVDLVRHFKNIKGVVDVSVMGR